MSSVFKGLMIWGSKCHQNNSPVIRDGYVKYEEAEVDRLVAILEKITAAAADRVEYSKQPASDCLIITQNTPVGIKNVMFNGVN